MRIDIITVVPELLASPLNESILKRAQESGHAEIYVESFGMRWSVVESLPVCESIKYGGPDRDALIENYKQSLRNLSAEGVTTI